MPGPVPAAKFDDAKGLADRPSPFALALAVVEVPYPRAPDLKLGLKVRPPADDDDDDDGPICESKNDSGE